MQKNLEITLRKKHGEFSSCWIAGNNLKQNALVRTYKRDEIDGIDVSELCDKLRSLNENFGSSVGTDRAATSNEARHLPFRVYSRLVFGALVILREQVTHLLDDTQRLLQTSSTNDHNQRFDQPNQNLKRKRFSANIKESRLSFKKQANDEINYSTLLDEAEFLTNTDAVNFSQEPHQIQMREVEITIRDFSVDIASAVTAEPVDEIGNATIEELSTLIDIFAADTTGSGLGSVRENLKRRLIDNYEEVGAAKTMKFFSTGDISIDANIELVRNTNTASSATYFDSIELDLCADTTQEMCAIERSQTSTSLDASLDALPNCSNIRNESLVQLNLSPPRIIGRKRKLMLKRRQINKNSEINISRMEMISQSSNYLAVIEREFFKSKEKRKYSKCPFNIVKTCKLFPNMFKNWIKPSTQKIFNEYVNLIREIMGCDYEAKMANEIASQPINQVVSHQNQRRLEKQMAPNQAPIPLSQSILEPIVELKANVNDFENDSYLASNPYFGEITKGPAYVTMLQLLKFCVDQNSFKVSFRKFVCKMPNRIEAALAFHNLLGNHKPFLVAPANSCLSNTFKALSRDSFITMETRPGTTEAVNILLCEKSKKLFDVLKQSQANKD